MRDLGAQHELAQPLCHRARRVPAAAPRRILRLRCARTREQRDDAALRIVQAGERRCRPRASFSMSAESWPCRNRAASAPRNASTPNPSGALDRSTAAGVLIFVFAGVSYGRTRRDSGRIRARAECPFRRRFRRASRRRAGARLPTPQGACRSVAAAVSRNRRSAGARAHALRRLGKKWPLRRFLRIER